MRLLALLFLVACNPDDTSPSSDGNGGDDGAGDDGSGDDGSGDDGGGGDDSGTTDGSGTDDTGPDCTPIAYYLDVDHDGYGAGDLLSDCEPIDAADVAGDCDDNDSLVHPDQKDTCNGADDDCDKDTDEDAVLLLYYADADGDGYGVPGVKGEACVVPAGFSDLDTDCDDTDATMSPGNPEDWTDGAENNCDGIMEIESPVEVPEATGASYDAPTTEPVKLRMLGVYESSGAGHAIDVLHDVPEAVFLVLESYDTVAWNITETYPGTVQGIIVSSYSPATTVAAPKGVPVENHVGPYGFITSSAYDWDDYQTRDLVTFAQDATGFPVTSFHGNYAASAFTIQQASDWMDVSAYPDCSKKPSGTAGGPPDVTALDPVVCADVLDSQHICLTGSGTQITAFGLDEGDTCTAASLPSSFLGYKSPSIAWSDEWVYACAGDYGMLERASLATGQIEKSYIYCDGVSSVDGALYVRNTGGGYWATGAEIYDDWDAATCGFPSASVTLTSNNRVTVHNGILYSSSGYGTSFDWEDLGGAASGTVELEGYKGGLQGIDVSDDGWFMFIGDTSIRWQSVDDGHFFSELPAAWPGYGLACALQ